MTVALLCRHIENDGECLTNWTNIISCDYFMKVMHNADRVYFLVKFTVQSATIHKWWRKCVIVVSLVGMTCLSIVCPSDHVKVDVFIDFLNAHAGRWRHKPAVRFILAASQCLPKLSPKMLCLPITHKK